MTNPGLVFALPKRNANDRIITLANNVLGYVEGDDLFMMIGEAHSGYNRMYQLTTHNGTHAMSRLLAMNEMADFVDGVISTVVF